MNALGDCAQTGRSVIDGVHRRNDREQNLRSTNVTRRFVAADVLLARLQRESIRGAALGIVRNTDQSSWHMAFELIARCKIGSVRSAETERHAEALCVSNRDVGTEFARRL